MLFAEVLKSALFGVFKYSGRSDRLEHWTFSFLTAVAVIATIILGKLGVPMRGWVLLAMLFGAIWLLLAHISLFVRRLHDQNRSGMFMMIPFVSVSVLLIGWLGQNGYIDHFPGFFRDYGIWVFLGGRSLCIISAGMLASVFIGEGDHGENYYGDPVF